MRPTPTNEKKNPFVIRAYLFFLVPYAKNVSKSYRMVSVDCRDVLGTIQNHTVSSIQMVCSICSCLPSRLN